MSEHQTSDQMASDDTASQTAGHRPSGHTSDTRTAHRYGSDSPPVLTRMPNLEPLDPETDPPVASGRRREGRLLSSPLAVPLLAGTAVLLLLVAVLTSMFAGKDPAGSASKNDSPGWQPEVPAPSAPLAPSWTTQRGEFSESGFSQGGIPQSVEPNDTSQPPAWQHPVVAQARHEQPETAPRGSPWPRQTSEAPQQSPESGNDLRIAQSPDWPQGNACNGQARAACMVGQRSHFQEAPQPRTSSWESYLSGSTAQAQAKVSPRRTPAQSTSEARLTQHTWPSEAPNQTVPAVGHTAPPYSYDTEYQASRRPPAYRNDYQQQASPNSSTAPDQPTPGQPSAYGTPYRQRSPSVDRNAVRPNPQAAQPQYEYRSDTRYGSQRDYQAEYQDPYPTDTYSANAYRTNPYPTRDAPAGLSSTSTYGADRSTQSAEPGVARFQGVIEKPTVRMTDDRYRSRVY